ncbi:MAG: hypothetical protein WA890_01115 [Micromonospora sp.]
MTSVDPTAPQQRTPVESPPTAYAAAPAVRERRGPLRTTRDVVAIIRDVLLIIVLAALLIFGGAVVKGISDLGNDLNSPDPTSTCIGEEPC